MLNEDKFKVSTVSPDDYLNEVDIFDIETYSKYDLKKQSEKYITDAKAKWIGFYSFKSNKYYEIEINESNKETIKAFIDSHRVLVGWNSNNFDIPILKNNNLYPSGYKISLDLKEILKEKKRAIIMGYKFKSYSMRYVAKDMNLPTLKGDIDYMIFKQDSYTEDERADIIKYLRGDIEVTKLVFDYMYNMFKPICDFLDDKNIKNWSWLGCSSGTLSYKVMCGVAGLEEKYGEWDPNAEKEEVGGFVFEPIAEEQFNVWYKDFSSLYPSIIIMLNSFGNPTLRPDCTDWFEGNELFKIKGKYAKDKKHILTELYEFLFYTRKPIKKTQPRRAQTYKIILNGGYGVLRAPMFLSTYYKHTGEDICQVGQDLSNLASKIYKKYGFNTVFGDTDSRGFVHENKELSIEEQLKLMKQADEELYATVKKYAPFPFDGFNFESETGDIPVVWMGFNYDKTKKKYKKKNYAFITKTENGHKVKLKGLSLIKDDATKLSMYIYKKHIEPRMLEELHGKFEEFWIKQLVRDELKDNWQELAVTYNVKPANTYSTLGDIRAQISLKYFDGASGQISLYKNNKVGSVGKGACYCTYEEAVEGNLQITDLDLTKVHKELEPFVKGGYSNRNFKAVQISGYF